MARDNSIAISDEELKKLKDARLEVFNTDEVPYGATIDELCERVLNG